MSPRSLLSASTDISPGYCLQPADETPAGLKRPVHPRTLLISEVFLPRVGGTSTWFYEVYRRYPLGEAMILTDHLPGADVGDQRLSMPIRRVPMHMADWGFLHPRSARRYVSLALRTWHLVRTHHIGRIHCARAIPEGVIGYLLGRLARIPYSIYAHGEEIGTARTSRQLTFLTTLAFRAATHVIANSENTRTLLHGVGVPDSKIVVITPGVDTARFSPGDGARARRILGFDDRRLLLTVGRLQRRKGHDMVIRALPGIAATIPDIRYVIAGSGEEEHTLRALAKQLRVEPLVEFVGHVPHDQLVELYRACDLFIMPNREELHEDIEGFGIVFLEAAACGKPVVAGRSGGAVEAVIEGETALLVDGKDQSAISHAVLSLLSDRARAQMMGRNGRVWAERSGWDDIAVRTRGLQ